MTEANYYSFNFANQEIKVAKGWQEVFISQQKSLKNIEKKITAVPSEPPTAKIFRIFKKPPRACKVIILGQDPYPQPETATGRAFEVQNYRDWQKKTQNASLRNLLKELYREAKEIDESPAIKEVRREVDRMTEILPPAELFQRWEERGVFLLNTALTVQQGKPGSHQELWRPFIKEVITTLAAINQEKYWLLWGNKAQKFQELVESAGNKIITAPHPSRYDFVGSTTFSVPVVKNIVLASRGDDGNAC